MKVRYVGKESHNGINSLMEFAEKAEPTMSVDNGRT